MCPASALCAHIEAQATWRKSADYLRKTIRRDLSIVGECADKHACPHTHPKTSHLKRTKFAKSTDRTRLFPQKLGKPTCHFNPKNYPLWADKGLEQADTLNPQSINREGQEGQQPRLHAANQLLDSQCLSAAFNHAYKVLRNLLNTLITIHSLQLVLLFIIIE